MCQTILSQVKHLNNADGYNVLCLAAYGAAMEAAKACDIDFNMRSVHDMYADYLFRALDFKPEDIDQGPRTAKAATRLFKTVQSRGSIDEGCLAKVEELVEYRNPLAALAELVDALAHIGKKLVADKALTTSERSSAILIERLQTLLQLEKDIPHYIEREKHRLNLH